MKKTLPIIAVLIIIIIIAGGSFYGGMKYGQSKSSSGNFSVQNFQNLSPEQRQQLFQGNAGGNFSVRRGGAGFLSGEVIGKDEQSLTLKTSDGGSKIVFLSASTTVSEMTEGSINDIVVGEQITITGTQNSDGSYTAQTIQKRPLTSPDNSR
ncbi:MAG: hypothetical protein PHE52_02600 [Candidatus Pacebacteria bacterium]|nr:hypothetical protein [Candidatus Paceibacterota bacterium]